MALVAKLARKVLAVMLMLSGTVFSEERYCETAPLMRLEAVWR